LDTVNTINKTRADFSHDQVNELSI